MLKRLLSACSLIWLLVATLAAAAETVVVASILPTSRAIETNTSVTVYASVVNAGAMTASDCGIAVADTFSGSFSYYTTDPATNQINSDADPSVNIPAGAVQTYALSLQPEAEMDAEIHFEFSCTNAPEAPVYPGINTLRLVSSDQPIADIVALAATSRNDGTVHLDAFNGNGALAVATVNLGADEEITVIAGTSEPTAGVAVSVCRTNPISGQCEQPSTPQLDPLAVGIAGNATPTFGIFVSADTPIPADPVNNRIVVRFEDAAGALRGSTSVALTRESAYANWQLNEVAPAEVGLDATRVAAVVDEIFTDAAVQGALMVHQGSIVAERYMDDRDQYSLGTTWSVAKSFYAALVGIALGDGAIADLDEPVSQYVADWQGTERAAVTIRELLQMRAGLPGDSNGCGGLFINADQTPYALNRDLVRTPGSAFQYSNCGSQVIEPLLRGATGTDAHTMVQSRLLAPIGINTSAVGLWTDPTGVTPMTYCCMDMTLRDIARFGLLMTRRGEWDGQQILPPTFVDETLQAANATAFYGLHWWILNAAYFGAQPPITLASAQGLDGQWIIVWPEQDLLIAIATRYEHPPEQGYVLSLQNFPDTCSARNTCPGNTGGRVPRFDAWTLVQRIAELF